jgi:isopentenyldiphosphate isomerase/predicted RNase H-like HicB family nuclease
MDWKVILERDPETGDWAAWCPELPGCTSAGATQEEALKNIEEAIKLYLDPTNEIAGAKELYDIYDESGKRVGRATRKHVHSDPQLIHRAVHILVFRSSGNLVMQKRVKTKDVAPGKWDTSVGGHVDAGEDYETAALREMKEELGISGVPLEHLYDFKYRSPRESEDVRTYRIIYDGELFPEWFEIEQVREWTLAEIDAAIPEGTFTRNFEQDWGEYRAWLGRKK